MLVWPAEADAVPGRYASPYRPMLLPALVPGRSQLLPGRRCPCEEMDGRGMPAGSPRVAAVPPRDRGRPSRISCVYCMIALSEGSVISPRRCHGGTLKTKLNTMHYSCRSAAWQFMAYQQNITYGHAPARLPPPCPASDTWLQPPRAAGPPTPPARATWPSSCRRP